MGKIMEKVRVTNLFDPEKSVEVEAVVDIGATMLVLPENIVEELNLRKMREAKVRYANNKAEIKPVYGVVTVEICGRGGEFNVLGEREGAQPLVGQTILEQLDLIVDPSGRRVIPDPGSPDMPVVEVLCVRACGGERRAELLSWENNAQAAPCMLGGLTAPGAFEREGARR